MALPKGITSTSSMIVVSSTVEQTAPNTFASAEIDLALNALDQEAFVVYAVQSDLANPDAIAGVNTSVGLSLSTTA
ncbi:unnamed protein product, partial [marine sediment metagenome]